MLRDKDIGGVLRALAPRITRWHLASLPGRARRRPRELAAQLAALGVASASIHAHASPAQAFAAARESANENDKIVVFGSFLTVGEVKAWLKRQQDIETLKRRGRRRLVGAVALVLAAVIVLPMVFDPEPRRGAPPVSVRIPGEDEAPFKPKPVPRPAPKSSRSAAGREARRKAAAAPVEKPEATGAKAEPAQARSRPSPQPPSRLPSERARAEAALAGAEYRGPGRRLRRSGERHREAKAAKLPYYTENGEGQPDARARRAVSRARKRPRRRASSSRAWPRAGHRDRARSG